MAVCDVQQIDRPSSKIIRQVSLPVCSPTPARPHAMHLQQALAIGLVDKLGGLEDAIVAARAAAELPDDAYVYDYPERRLSPFLLLLSGLMPAEARALAQSASAKLAGADAGTGGVIAVLATIASACGLGGGAAGLTAGSAAAGSGGRGSSAALAALTGIGGGAMCYSPEAEMLSRCT